MERRSKVITNGCRGEGRNEGTNLRECVCVPVKQHKLMIARRPHAF
jgi:hypothetical protein